MCRFILYQGPTVTIDTLTTRPENSIIHQSFQSRLGEQPLNGDGFGFAWYVPELSHEPALFRSTQPAWNDLNLQQIARVSQSHLIFAHVRAATGGTDVSKANCHPFVHGCYAFMHNGSVAEFRSVRRAWMQSLSDNAFNQIQGQTDSEVLFAVFLDAISDRCAAESLADAIRSVIRLEEQTRDQRRIEAPNYFNLAVTDGSETVVTRFASGSANPRSLFYAVGQRCLCEDGQLIMEQAPGGNRHSAQPPSILVASEPLSDQSLWQEIEPSRLVSIDRAGEVCIEPIEV